MPCRIHVIMGPSGCRHGYMANVIGRVYRKERIVFSRRSLRSRGGVKSTNRGNLVMSLIPSVYQQSFSEQLMPSSSPSASHQVSTLPQYASTSWRSILINFGSITFIQHKSQLCLELLHQGNKWKQVWLCAGGWQCMWEGIGSWVKGWNKFNEESSKVHSWGSGPDEDQC